MFESLNKRVFKGGSNGSKWIPLEKIDFGTIYSFSWNPSQQPQSFQHRDLAIYYREMYDIWSQLTGVMFYLLPEVSTQANRFHFHGLIAFKDFMAYLQFKDVMGNKANNCLDYITSPISWYAYIYKQQKYMRKLNFFEFRNRDVDTFLDYWLLLNDIKYNVISVEKLIMDESL